MGREVLGAGQFPDLHADGDVVAGGFEQADGGGVHVAVSAGEDENVGGLGERGDSGEGGGEQDAAVGVGGHGMVSVRHRFVPRACGTVARSPTRATAGRRAPGDSVMESRKKARRVFRRRARGVMPVVLIDAGRLFTGSPP